MTSRTGILITSFFAFLAFTFLESQILTFSIESTPKTPEVAGASIGAVVEPTPLNTGWEELKTEQEKLRLEKEKLLTNKNSFAGLFQPTERTIRYLYMFLFILLSLVIINIVLDIYILKSKKRKNYA